MRTFFESWRYSKTLFKTKTITTQVTVDGKELPKRNIFHRIFGIRKYFVDNKDRVRFGYVLPKNARITIDYWVKENMNEYQWGNQMKLELTVGEINLENLRKTIDFIKYLKK